MAWQQRKPLIVIGCPHQGYFETEFTLRTWYPLLGAQVDWCDKIPSMVKDYGVVHARNSIVTNAIKSGAKYIFWVDSDIIFEGTPNNPGGDPNVALKMLYDTAEKHNFDIVSGLYRAKKPEGFMWAAWVQIPDAEGKPSNPPKFTPITGYQGDVVQVDVIGLGCCLTRVDLFKRMDKPYFKWDMPEQISEDFDFCLRAKEKGAPTKILTEIKCSHMGVLVVESTGNVRTVQA